MKTHGALEHAGGATGTVGTMVAVGDGDAWACAASDRIQLWRGSTLELEELAPTRVAALRFGTGGALLAAPHAFDLRTRGWRPLPRPEPLGAGYELAGAGWDPGGALLVLATRFRPAKRVGAGSGPASGTRRLHAVDGASGRVTAELYSGAGHVSYSAIAVDDAVVAAADAEVRLWGRADLSPLATLEAGRIVQRQLALGGGLLAAVSAEGCARTWSLPDLRATGSWMAHPEEALAVAVHPGGTLVATGGVDGRVSLRGSDGAPHGEAELGGAVGGVAFAPDGGMLVAVTSDPPAATFLAVRAS